VNQQWYLEYVEDGWFYIRNRNSAKCLEVADASTANIQQWEKNGGTNQQWRFLPVGAPVEFVSPGAPGNLIATANAESIRLDWSASEETDVVGYTIFRSESTGGPYITIARNVKSTSFVDNTTSTGGQYFYTIKAIDNSLNRSVYSNEASATATGNNDLVAHLQFDGNTLDSTINLNHGASYGGTASFGVGKVGSKAIALNGTNAFVQLPANLANQQEITIATWVYWKGGAAWQRIFDFGNDQAEYMFLTPSSGSELRFAIKNNGAEQTLSATMLPVNKWSHVTITLGASGASMYVNGKLVDESTAFTISPLDFKPMLNYIGRSQFPDPLFNGLIDDFRVYNYALSPSEVAQISESLITNVVDADPVRELSLWPVPANDILYINYSTEHNNDLSTLTVFNTNGGLVMSKDIKDTYDTELNVSNLASGFYILKLTNSEESIIKKLIITH
ncbi:MAG TPA: LamG-like jellyroll fold domain-containing protein, partial [Cyclobacteriaceae bacterium]|nr:LamG-like jellyroll fold domain-containing protein [Cyclobacteriaceae bacterium]